MTLDSIPLGFPANAICVERNYLSLDRLLHLQLTRWVVQKLGALISSTLNVNTGEAPQETIMPGWRHTFKAIVGSDGTKSRVIGSPDKPSGPSDEAAESDEVHGGRVG